VRPQPGRRAALGRLDGWALFELGLLGPVVVELGPVFVEELLLEELLFTELGLLVA